MPGMRPAKTQRAPSDRLSRLQPTRYRRRTQRAEAQNQDKADSPRSVQGMIAGTTCDPPPAVQAQKSDRSQARCRARESPEPSIRGHAKRSRPHRLRRFPDRAEKSADQNADHRAMPGSHCLREYKRFQNVRALKCHSERSEESFVDEGKILRSPSLPQNDNRL